MHFGHPRRPLARSVGRLPARPAAVGARPTGCTQCSAEPGCVGGICKTILPAAGEWPALVHGSGVLLPVPFPQTRLHILRAGVFVGNVQKGCFVPEHHLFTAFGSQCTNCEQLTRNRPPLRSLSVRDRRMKPAPHPMGTAAFWWTAGLWGAAKFPTEKKIITPRHCACCQPFWGFR